MKKLVYFLLIVIVAIAAYRFGVNSVETPDNMQLSSGFRDGKYLGYIHNIDVSRFKISFDDAVMLNGVAAQDAAIEAGYCTEVNRSECTPNDYFIKNAEKRDEIVLLDEAVLLFMQTWKMEETGEVMWREIGLADFAGLIHDTKLHWRQLPYNITIQNGKVTRVEEVYIP